MNTSSYPYPFAYAAFAGDEATPYTAPSDEGTVVASPLPRGLDTRAVLLRRLLADDVPESLDSVEGALPEDLALVTGDLGAARARFTERVLRGPDPDAWVGLGLALRGQGHPAAGVLLSRPELVSAVHALLGGEGDPVRLAAAFGD
ncbi:hypothetical protein ACVNF4_04670 [Streptomyces sp. S6]